MLLRCPYCQSMDHLSKWVKCTADVLTMNIFPAALSPVYVCPKCFKASPSANLPHINHY